MKQILNHTGLPISIVTKEGVIQIPVHGDAPHVDIRRMLIEMEGGIPIMQQAIKSIKNLPPKISGTYYVVSKTVAMFADRDDFIIVDDLIRDKESRQVIACNNLSFLPKEKKK